MRNEFEAVRESPNKLRFGWILLSIVLILFLHQNSVADAPETFAQALTRNHIELTKPALIQALRNSDNEVRGLAAWQLMEMKADDSLPQILQALRDERDPQTKVNLASAAANLGAKEGAAELLKECHSSALPSRVRIDAARHLLHNNDRSCMPDLLNLMTSANDSATRSMALNLVSQRSDLTALEAAQTMRASLEMLCKADPHWRLEAARFLVNLHNANAIPYLRTAIQVEPEEVIRSQMQISLESLLALKSAP